MTFEFSSSSELRERPLPTVRMPPAINRVPILIGARRGMSLIVDLVAHKHGLRRDEVLGRSQFKQVVAARKEAMTLCLSHTGQSSMAVGQFFDRRWTTVLYAAGCLAKSKKHKAQGAALAKVIPANLVSTPAFFHSGPRFLSSAENGHL